ncbi:MAG: T9SS type A sorting domain-containing protein, partial [Cytophagales bacterium]|nr:T9SS type A sorting domain-containing protein [Cytophagales bacterium]
LIDAGTDLPVKTVKPGEDFYLPFQDVEGKRFNIRAEYDSVPVSSVRFKLYTSYSSSEKMDNTAPFTWASEAPKAGGGTDYQGITLVPGKLEVEAIAYSQPNGAGSWSSSIRSSFSIGNPQYRVAAAQPGAEGAAAFRVAPNPFNGRTTISFTATESGPATVEVYNAQGTPVARLYEGTLEKGKAYAWPFDGSTQPAGLYFARLKVSHRLLHQRLVLTK